MKLGCCRGHRFNETNAKWIRHANGKYYAQCRICNSLRMKLRYRHDENFRNRERQRSLARYYEKKENAHVNAKFQIRL